MKGRGILRAHACCQPVVRSGLALVLVSLISADAQIGVSGSIQGVITDPSGAVAPNATVRATRVATGVNTTRQTSSAGYHNLSPLPAGEYSVSVAAPGFQTLVQPKVVVDALSVVGLNLALQLGSANQQVTVSAAPPVLDTSDASMGQTVRNEVYTALPLAMAGNAPRNPAAFTQYMPRVTGAVGNTAGSVYGTQGNSQDVYVEGMPITNVALEGEVRNVALGVSVEAVDQFQMETAGTAPMYQGEGSTNSVIKSGTNHFHGSAYEYFRHTDLDACGFSASRAPVEHTNEVGFDIGGPIVKNRIFFFGIAGPSGYDEDLSLKRDFGIHETLKLALQVDAINIFNFVNFNAPNLSITSTGFGKITSQANSPRV